MNLPQPETMSFSALISEIEKGSIKIPQFQREFVWSKDKSAKLLDSIVKGYPIGTFILWKSKEELRTIRNLGGLELPKTPKGDYINYVLDGQQRLTSLFASIKGLVIVRDDQEEDFSEFYLDLQATGDDPIVLKDKPENSSNSYIKLHSLLYGKFKDLAVYPEALQERMQKYKDRLTAYPFSILSLKDASINVATEVFTRINVSGVPLSLFEIMVAKTYSSTAKFDLAEKFSELLSELESVDYATIPSQVVLQVVSILLKGECRKKDILELPREKVIKIWPQVTEAIKHTVDFFRNTYRIPVSRLLPYPNVMVPFAYYFHKRGQKPTGNCAILLQDLFWRIVLSGRYSQGVENRVAQDVKRIDTIIQGKTPDYDWAVDISPEFINKNGLFSVGRSYIKALLCLLAFKEPKSFVDNSIVRISNDWLKQANSKNYHHYFPRAYLAKRKYSEEDINHIANITIVDDFLNKREIRAQSPSLYMKRFAKQNDKIDSCMRTHLINLNTDGVYENDYEKFIQHRCRALSRELGKRIVEHGGDNLGPVTPASMTVVSDAD